MSVLRNLEAKLGGLVEGAFGRAFKTNVQPVELAHKLAKEMEDNQMVSVSRVYVPEPLPRLPLRAGPRAVRELRAGAAQGAVGLPARARAPGAARAHQPPADRVPHRRAAERRRVRHPGPAAATARGRGSAAEPPGAVGGRLRPHDGLLARPRRRGGSSPRRRRRRARQALLVGRGQAQRAERRRVVLGRSRDCDVVRRRPERLAPPRRAAPRRARAGRSPTSARPTGSRSTAGASTRRRCATAIASRSGVTDLTFELD